MFVTFIAKVKSDTPLFGNLSNLRLLSSPLFTNKLICKSSVAEVGISRQSCDAPQFVQARSCGWLAAIKSTSSRAIPSSTNSRSFQSTLLLVRCGMPSRRPILVSISSMHIGPISLTASLSSVLIQSLFPPGAPSNNSSKLSLTVAELLPLTKAVASIPAVAQSSPISMLNNAKL